MLVGIGEQLFAGIEIPFAPGGDDVHLRPQGVCAQFEANLIIALAGRTVRDTVGAGLARDIDQSLGDQRPRNRCAQQVLALVDGIGAKHREDEITHELFAQVIDVDFLDAELLGLGPDMIKFLALTDIGRKGHDLAVVGVLQPFEDDGGIQATGISEDDFANVGHGAIQRLEQGDVGVGPRLPGRQSGNACPASAAARRGRLRRRRSRIIGLGL